jgi:hypothetical protein
MVSARFRPILLRGTVIAATDGLRAPFANEGRRDELGEKGHETAIAAIEAMGAKSDSFVPNLARTTHTVGSTPNR